MIIALDGKSEQSLYGTLLEALLDLLDLLCCDSTLALSARKEAAKRR